VTPQELAKCLAAGRIDPVYLLAGEESWLADQALAALRRYATAPDDLMNTHMFSGAEVSPEEIVAIAQTLPAWADRRFVAVRDAERLAASDALTAYCADPAPSTCLVLVMAKPDRRKAWVQTLLGRATTIVCAPLKPAALKAWLQHEAAAQRVSLTDDAAAYLVAKSEGSLRALCQDLAKIALSGRDAGTPHDVAAVAALSPENASVSVFEWAHATALLLLSILAGQWRKMIRWRGLVDQGASEARASQALGLPPFAADRVADGAKRRDLPELLAGLTWCLETDAAIKGGALSPALAIERLVLALCDGSPAPSGRATTGPWWPGLSARREAVGVASQAGNQS
jgi:DNA polymerase-3 subunit delta